MSSLTPDRLAGHVDAAVLPWQLVRVAGPSMVPTLRHGDLVLVRRGGRPAPGQVVLAQFADLGGTLVVKRLVRWVGLRAELASDNRSAGGDSTTHGLGQVLGRVLWVLAPGRPHKVV